MRVEKHINRLCAIERRCGTDRRKNKISIFSKHSFAGNRQFVRRREDREMEYSVDRYDSKLLTPILLIIFFSICDAFLTLILLDKGAVEINPVMAYSLTHGHMVFFIVKYLLTTFSLIIILVYSNTYLFKTRLRTKSLFGMIIIPFGLVIYWEFFLISMLS